MGLPPTVESERVKRVVRRIRYWQTPYPSSMVAAAIAW